ncbi:hypothetical protein NPIL_58661 [Nephila pilipes]|uniref:Uncharacterized protein n=1 Tax=Nephila pilipes TaxID=299642 RepID=A0A8X6U4X0_NEPPI|nr:hypothetical protein NPIL_58661 [Nephila pilipes]
MMSGERAVKRVRPYEPPYYNSPFCGVHGHPNSESGAPGTNGIVRGPFLSVRMLFWAKGGAKRAPHFHINAKEMSVQGSE